MTWPLGKPPWGVAVVQYYFDDTGGVLTHKEQAAPTPSGGGGISKTNRKQQLTAIPQQLTPIRQQLTPPNLLHRPPASPPLPRKPSSLRPSTPHHLSNPDPLSCSTPPRSPSLVVLLPSPRKLALFPLAFHTPHPHDHAHARHTQSSVPHHPSHDVHQISPPLYLPV